MEHDPREQARAQLRLRLWPDGRDRQGAEVLAMPVMPGAHAVVCRDLPYCIETVSGSAVQDWGLSPQDAFSLGMHNTLAAPANEERMDGPLGVDIHLHSGEHPFVAARVLALERWVDSAHGAVVAVPTEHHLLFHPLTDDRAVAAMQAVWMLAQSVYHQGPKSLLPELFWWTPGRLMRIEVQRDPDSDALAVRPPPAFAEVLGKLPRFET